MRGTVQPSHSEQQGLRHKESVEMDGEVKDAREWH